MKPRGCNAQMGVEKRRSVFVWHDKTCCDFEPKQKSGLRIRVKDDNDGE